MGKNSSIEWTDHTFNPWIGCTKISPGCDNCYAEQFGKRFGINWGARSPRRLTAAGNWAQVRRWNRDAKKAGHTARVFCASLADVFDNEVPDAWLNLLWDLIKKTPDLTWIIVTKRIGNAEAMLPADWGAGYPNVTVLITVCNQDEVDRDTIKLLDLPAARRGLSIGMLTGKAAFRSRSDAR